MIYENVIKGNATEILWEHWIMFPDWRYFIIDTHSCLIFNNLYCCKLISWYEMSKYNELIWMNGWWIEDQEKIDNMWKILIDAWFIKVQGRYITGAKFFYKEINKEQWETFKKMGIIINESNKFLLSK